MLHCNLQCSARLQPLILILDPFSCSLVRNHNIYLICHSKINHRSCSSALLDVYVELHSLSECSKELLAITHMTNRCLAKAACKTNTGEEDREIPRQQSTTLGFGRRMRLSPGKLGTKLHLGLTNGPVPSFTSWVSWIWPQSSKVCEVLGIVTVNPLEKEHSWEVNSF